MGLHFEIKRENNTDRICVVHSGITSYSIGCVVYLIISTSLFTYAQYTLVTVVGMYLLCDSMLGLLTSLLQGMNALTVW